MPRTGNLKGSVLAAIMLAWIIGVASAQDGPTTLTVWRGNLGPAWDDLEQEIVAQFEAEHPNVQVEDTTFPWGTFREKLFTGFRFGGELPCIIWEGLNLTGSYIATGGLAPLDGYLETWGYRDVVADNLWGAVSYDGQIYGLPFGGIPFVTLFNKQMFEDAGVTPPTTWDEWLEISERLTNPDEDQYAWAVRSDRLLQSYFVELLWQAGGELFEGGMRAPGSGDPAIAFNSDLGVRALTELVARAEFAPGGVAGNIGLGGPDAVNLFANGRIAMLSGSIHQYGQTLAINPEMEDNIGIFLNPPGPGEQGRDTNFLITQALFMTEQCEYKDVAASYMEHYVRAEWELERAARLGYAPLRSDLSDSSVLEDPIIRTGMAAVERGTLQPDFPAWLEFRSTLMNEIQRVFLGQATPAEALDNAAEILETSLAN